MPDLLCWHCNLCDLELIGYRVCSVHGYQVVWGDREHAEGACLVGPVGELEGWCRGAGACVLEVDDQGFIGACCGED